MNLSFTFKYNYCILFLVSSSFRIVNRVPKQERTQISIWPAVFFATVIIAAVVVLAGCKKQPSEQADTQQSQQSPTTGIENSAAKLSLNDVIRSRMYWDTAFTYWYGRKAPDFNLTDITGRQHRLSDYRGKDVMIIFWAAWCRPCIMEMPHLIELRKTTDEDKLAMLAISYKNKANTTEMVRSMVEQQKVNYTVFSVHIGEVPKPYSEITGIPCSFFIDPEGKIKLATLGVLSLDTIKAILEAE
jgi:peroxiredoxin